MNPAHFKERTLEDVLSTLVHEQVHVWQSAFGKPGRRRYHNQEWADKMKSVGLQPTDTGLPRGKETGDRVTHYILPGGPFQKAFRKLKKFGIKISWQDRYSDESEGAKKKRNTRTKYSCPECGLNAWAKPDVALVCGQCDSSMEAVE